MPEWDDPAQSLALDGAYPAFGECTHVVRLDSALYYLGACDTDGLKTGGIPVRSFCQCQGLVLAAMSCRTGRCRVGSVQGTLRA